MVLRWNVLIVFGMIWVILSLGRLTMDTGKEIYQSLKN